MCDIISNNENAWIVMDSSNNQTGITVVSNEDFQAKNLYEAEK